MVKSTSTIFCCWWSNLLLQDIKKPARIYEFKQILKEVEHFVKQACLPDVYMAGTMYADEALEGIGGGIGNYDLW